MSVEETNDKANTYKELRCMPEFSVIISFLEAFGERIGIRNVTAEVRSAIFRPKPILKIVTPCIIEALKAKRFILPQDTKLKIFLFLQDLENALINSENSALVYTVHKSLLKELGKKIGYVNPLLK